MAAMHHVLESMLDYAVQSAARNNRAREALIFKRLETIAQLQETP